MASLEPSYLVVSGSLCFGNLSFGNLEFLLYTWYAFFVGVLNAALIKTICKRLEVHLSKVFDEFIKLPRSR
jgi:hypothetical protein